MDSMKRSRLIIFVVGAAVLVFFALRFFMPGSKPAATLVNSPLFVDVKAQDVLAEIKKSKFTLVNIWATWCEPCREEFPVLVDLRKLYIAKGVQFLFVSADFTTQKNEALEFLQAHGVDFKSYHKSEEDAGFINALYPDWTGAIPATLIFDEHARLLKQWQGAATREEFESALHEVLGGV
jgi:thiol-disulfide isomerase/thioredoxin